MAFFIIPVLVSCGGPEPIPKDKADFIGVWESSSGFQIQILPEGYANVYQPTDSLHSEYARLHISKVNAIYNFGFEVEFLGDTAINIKKPYHSGRQYTIGKNPYLDADTMKMVINGVVVRRYSEDLFMSDL